MRENGRHLPQALQQNWLSRHTYKSWHPVRRWHACTDLARVGLLLLLLQGGPPVEVVNHLLHLLSLRRAAPQSMRNATAQQCVGQQVMRRRRLTRPAIIGSLLCHSRLAPGCDVFITDEVDLLTPLALMALMAIRLLLALLPLEDSRPHPAVPAASQRRQRPAGRPGARLVTL